MVPINIKRKCSVFFSIFGFSIFELSVLDIFCVKVLNFISSFSSELFWSLILNCKRWLFLSFYLSIISESRIFLVINKEILGAVHKSLTFIWNFLSSIKNFVSLEKRDCCDYVVFKRVFFYFLLGTQKVK